MGCDGRLDAGRPAPVGGFQPAAEALPWFARWITAQRAKTSTKRCLQPGALELLNYDLDARRCHLGQHGHGALLSCIRQHPQTLERPRVPGRAAAGPVCWRSGATPAISHASERPRRAQCASGGSCASLGLGGPGGGGRGDPGTGHRNPRPQPPVQTASQAPVD